MCHMQTICFVSFSSFFSPPPQSKVENVTKSRKQHPNQTLAFPVPSILLKEDKKNPFGICETSVQVAVHSRKLLTDLSSVRMRPHSQQQQHALKGGRRDSSLPALTAVSSRRRLLQKKKKKSLRSCRVGISGRSDTKENKKTGSLKWIRGFFLNNVLLLFIENYCCVICAAQCIT